MIQHQSPLVLLPVFLLAPVIPAQRRAPPVTARMRVQDPALAIRALAEQAEAAGARTGVQVRELGQAEPLCALRSSEPFIPASNHKVLTCAAAWRMLGAAHRFRTGFGLAGETLLVAAGGDPLLSARAEDLQHGATPPRELFQAVAGKLRAAGVARLDGLVADVSFWPGPARPPSWPQDQLGLSYCAPGGGLVLQDGCVDLEIAPGAADLASLRWEPAGLPLRIEGSIGLTGDKKAGSKYGASLRGDELKVWGAFWRRNPGATAELPVEDPALVFLQALRGCLQQAGIEVRGELRVLDDPAAVPKAAVLHLHESPLLPAVALALTDSSNFHAEMLLRALAVAAKVQGSISNGAALLLQHVAHHKPHKSEFVAVDGSGLSRDNRVSPRLLVAALSEVLAAAGGDAFLDCLAEGGRSGTLKDRFTEPWCAGRVRGKTGWIRGASTLTGVVTGDSGRRYVFSILMNYDPRKSGFNRTLHDWQDQMVKVLVKS
jgi:D-alanyl-D-alanine carboxypeptidase/D-alanyl-D-alanine-endopeptidase (penicillin-binding protein 4)